MVVMAGLVPAIHDLFGGKGRKTWMPGPTPGMTDGVGRVSQRARAKRGPMTGSAQRAEKKKWRITLR